MNAQRLHGGVWYCTNCLKELHTAAAAEILEMRNANPNALATRSKKDIHAMGRQSADLVQQSAKLSTLLRSSTIVGYAFALCHLSWQTPLLLVGVWSETAVVATTATLLFQSMASPTVAIVARKRNLLMSACARNASASIRR